MDEKEFERMIDSKFYDLKIWFQNNGYMKPVGDTPSSTPKQGGYTVGKTPCNKCGGKITWDNNNKTESGKSYPDHLDEDGNILEGGCPEYHPT